MDIQPFSKALYDRCLAVGIDRVTLEFSGGSDEGNLEISLYQGEHSASDRELERDIDTWVWDNYEYSGAGEGVDYGDNITYDLLKKTASHQGWSHEPVYGEETSEEFELED